MKVLSSSILTVDMGGHYWSLWCQTTVEMSPCSGSGISTKHLRRLNWGTNVVMILSRGFLRIKCSMRVYLNILQIGMSHFKNFLQTDPLRVWRSRDVAGMGGGVRHPCLQHLLVGCLHLPPVQVTHVDHCLCFGQCPNPLFLVLECKD